MAEHHYVRHMLTPGGVIHTEYKCDAPEGAQCRVTCRMQDVGRCLILDWLVNDAPEESFNGEEQPIRGPDWQPITPEWDGDNYCWDYAEIQRDGQ